MFEGFIAQSHITSAFERFIAARKLPHAIFWGPAGCGKTTLARLIAKRLGAEFYEFDAANFSLDSLRAAMKSSGALFGVIVFIDEIHRLNRAQQDSLLKPLESASFTLIGATTANPIYALNKALNSRTLAFEFKELNTQNLEEILKQNMLAGEFIEPSAKEYLITSSARDARAMLNLLHHARTLGDFSLETFRRLRPAVMAANESDYVIISALIKSMRASDVNASVYYLARALAGGIAPEYIARRLVVFASEDVGNAQPNALLLANAALQSVAQIGMPEARIILSQVVVFCASAKKSNSSYKAINQALAYVQSSQLPKIPPYLDNNAPEKQEYIYPHDYPDAAQPMAPGVPQFYADYGIGYEANFALWAQQGRYR